jgi:hypothetical protein
VKINEGEVIQFWLMNLVRFLVRDTLDRDMQLILVRILVRDTLDRDKIHVKFRHKHSAKEFSEGFSHGSLVRDFL